MAGRRRSTRPGGGKVIRSQTLAASAAYGQLAIACVSSTRCVEVDAAGHVAVFDPKRSSGPAASFTMTGAEGQTAVACPSRTRCVAETWQGVSVFDPAHVGSPATQSFSANGNGAQPTLSCPSTTLCVSVITQSTLEFITCESATVCAAAGNNQGVWVFNPKTPRHRHFTGVPTGVDLVGIAFAGRSELVLLGDDGKKAVIDPRHPPKTVTLTGLGRAASVA